MEQDLPLLDTTHQQQAKAPSFALRELSTRACRYSSDLTNRISRSLEREPLRGSTAVVYQGTLTPDGTKVAIKTFHCTQSGSEADLKRLFQEVHTWSKLRHKNIVPMFGFSREFDSTVSIISEWMPLGNAYIYVQNPENDPRPLLEDVASGLCYLHNHKLGIVHGNLKGLNVLVSSDRRALLSDFGLSTLNISTFSMTVDAKRGGSCHWMAPELLDDCSSSKESDVWAFGMTALELFTRTAPFSDCRNPANVFGRLMKGKLPLRPTRQSTQFRLSDAWWEICTSCWELVPSSRPVMKDIIEHVKAAISLVGLTVPPLEPFGPPCPTSEEAGSHSIPQSAEVAGSDTVTDPMSESISLMKTALEYPASAADTSISPSGTEFFSCLLAQPPLMSDLNDKWTQPTPPPDENDFVNMNQSNVKVDSPPTGLLPSLGSQMIPSLPTLEDRSQGIENVCREDIIIATMGRTGSGKSSFIDTVATGGMGEGVGHYLTPYTREVKATRCTFEESSVVLIDTPGFDDTRISDLDVLEMVSVWLNEKYQRGTTLAAILWFHRITDNHMVEVPLKNLRVFEKLCGKNALAKVILVTTMWDEMDDDIGEERLRELKDTRWKTMISQGSKTSKYVNTRESAMQLIRPIVHWQLEMTHKGVQLQEEISALELELRETISGQELCSRLEKLAERRIELLRIRGETHGVDIRREYVEIQAQLDSTLIRARALRDARKRKGSRKSVYKSL